MVIMNKNEDFIDPVFGVSVLICTQKTDSKQVILSSI